MGLLAVETYRRRFGSTLLDPLSMVLGVNSRSVQLVYEAGYCLWLLAFSDAVVAGASAGVVRALVDCLRVQKKEKVLRVCIATLTSMCSPVRPRTSRPQRALNEDEDGATVAAQRLADLVAELRTLEADVDEAKLKVSARHAETALEAGLAKLLLTMRTRRWADEELTVDLEMLNRALQRSMQDLSSFEKYKKEVLSGQLEWSPPHKSDTFWHENVDAFTHDDYRLVKTLKVLATNANTKIASIARYDLGEFARVHPRGKSILEDIGAKAVLISLMSGSKNADVQKEALFAIQKLMVTKYEYLQR